MTKDVISTKTPATRRNFLKTGALAAAPLAAMVPAAALADDGSKTRLARLESERAIEALHRAWLRSVRNGKNAEGLMAKGTGTISSIAADPAQEPAPLHFAADGQSAQARHACVIELEHAPQGTETFAQMARLQGNGTARRTEQLMLNADYIRRDGAWTIEKLRRA